MTRTLTISPLTRAAFAPFGQVIETEGARHFPINKGMTERFHDLAKVELGGTHPRPLISIFRGQPCELPLTLELVERHPFGSQAFYPLGPHPFLVIVAPDLRGKPGTPLVFRTRPGQGVNIAINTWHGALTPLNEVSDFLVVDRVSDGDNLEEYLFTEPYLIGGA